MKFYRLEIINDDYIYFASREIGQLIETLPIIGEYALNYATGLSESPYYHRKQIPNYLQELPPKNFIFPAIPSNYSREVHSWRFTRKEGYHQDQPSPKDRAINLPLFERICTLSPGSRFISYFATRTDYIIPHWIRLGKKLAKCEVTAKRIRFDLKDGDFESSHPVTGLTFASAYPLFSFSHIENRPPTSIIFGAKSNGKYLHTEAGDFPILR